MEFGGCHGAYFRQCACVVRERHQIVDCDVVYDAADFSQSSRVVCTTMRDLENLVDDFGERWDLLRRVREILQAAPRAED